MFDKFKRRMGNNKWVHLLLLFDFIFYLFVQLVTAPLDTQGRPDIEIHIEAIVFGFLASLVSLYTVYLIKERLSASRSSILTRYVKILLLSLLLYTIIVSAFMFGVEYLIGQQRGVGYIVGNGLILIFHHFIVGNSFIAYLYLKESSLLKEELILAEKMRAEAELKALQQQMSPHFLFNNLNTLTSLIDPGQKEALTFTKSLSNIYRYFTKNTGQDLTSLQEELDFIQHYFKLISQRFGKAYQLQVTTVGDDTNRLFLVPMALQLVSENVIKHNAGDRKNPLIIYIEVQDDCLVVKNELRQKLPSEPVTQSGTGLKNLDERCRLVMDRQLEYAAEDMQFIVKLPLIKQLADASTDY